jgi:hypothetical protein
MRYFSNALGDRRVYIRDIAGSSSIDSPAMPLSAHLTGNKTLTGATNRKTAEPKRVDPYVGSNKAAILVFAGGSTGDNNTTTEWTSAGATTIPRTEATIAWETRFGKMPLKADGTLDTEAMTSMVSAEFNTIYSAGTGGGASGGLDLGGHSMASFTNLSFDEQMRIAYAQKDAEMQENDAKFQAALQRGREEAKQQAALPPQKGPDIMAMIKEGLSLFGKVV